MSIRERMIKKKDKMLEQVRRGREVTEQQRAERLRKKMKRVTDMKPGAMKAIRMGLINRSSVRSVMHDELERRRLLREKKYKKQERD